MAVIEELIRKEDDGSISFGNYLMDEKKKVLDFEVQGDLYKVKTFKEITKLEKNGKMLLEAVPGATVLNFVQDERGVSFQVEAGERVGLIGRNGAGKTTTMKMLSGLLYPDSGKAQVMGYTPWERKRGYLAQIALLMGQKGQLLWDIPAYDSFKLNKEIYFLKEEQFQKTLKELAEILEVEHLLHIPVRNLSLGERMKMEIIAAMLHAPQILFLDEPTIGLDITTQKSLRRFLLEQNRKRGTTMLLTSHYMGDIVSLCSRIILIEQGSILFDGGIEEIRSIDEDQPIEDIIEKMCMREK